MPQDTTTQDTSAATTQIENALAEAWADVTGWVYGLVEGLPKLIAALVILVVFWLVAKAAAKVVAKLLERLARQREVVRLLAGVAFVVVMAAGLIVALGVLDLGKTVTAFLAGVGIVGLALGFAFQDIAENLIAGVILNVQDQFYEGDIIETNGFMGVVERVELRATSLQTFEGQRVLLPNSQIFKNPLVNYTNKGKRRVDIKVGVSYREDLEKAKRVALEAVAKIEQRDMSRDVEVFYEGFGASSIDFELRFWILFAKNTDYLEARSEAVMRIKRAFDQNRITIPFPIRTLDFGGNVVGAQGLAEALAERG